jgi:FkbM family methyltransferase
MYESQFASILSLPLKIMYKISPECQIKNLNEIYTKYFGFPSDGFFVEVGAYDGEFVSNTSFLADIGWKGLYIEPVYEYYQKCLKRHENNDVTVANVAIGLEEKEVTIFKGETLSTLNYEQVKRYGEIDWASHIKFDENTCDQIRLDSLMNLLKVPKSFDILVVDVEGKESEIFQTFDLIEWSPKMLIVELEDEHPSFQKYPDLIEEIKNLRQFITSKNYREIYKDPVNTVFVTENFYKEKL